KALRNYVDKQLQLQNKEITKTCNVCWIFAATKEKDISKILELLMRNGDSLFAVSFTNVEGMPWVKCYDPQVILEYANSLESKINSKVVENLDEALRQTFASYDEQSQIVVLYGNDLCRDISQLFEDADDYSVIIQIGVEPDFEEFKAHSVILRAR
ncbi:28661_t:CDS:2, partial [Dentiscutata erythropus]